MIRIILILILLLTSISGLLSCSTKTITVTEQLTSSFPSPTSSYYFAVNVAFLPDIGNYLVDKLGMTLYYNKNDRRFTNSLSREQLSNWPLFWTSSSIVSADLMRADFYIITWPNGQTQVTYKGWPLYYYIGDIVPGDIKGNGIDGIWSVVNHKTLSDAPELMD